MTLGRRMAIERLFRAEDALRRRCAIVGARLELAASALVLLEVVCHADAALDDLDRLAESRGVVVLTLSSRLRVLFGTVAGWLGDLWPVSATRVYEALLAEMQRSLALASSLRDDCAESGDDRMAAWCALWTEQRASLADRLAATLVEPSRAEAVEARSYV